MSEGEISFSEMVRYYTECVQRFGIIQDLPIVASCYQRCRELYHTGKVLDIGAGVQKTLKTALSLSDEDYDSLDNDPNCDFTFQSPEEIPAEARYAMVVASQVLEHLTPAETLEMMKVAAKHMAEGAYLIISVPNVQHPVRWRGDPTHVTPWNYKDLYMLIRYVGLECVEIVRYNKFPGPTSFLDRLVCSIVDRIYRIDWCDSIVAVGRKQLTGN